MRVRRAGRGGSAGPPTEALVSQSLLCRPENAPRAPRVKGGLQSRLQRNGRVLVAGPLGVGADPECVTNPLTLQRAGRHARIEA